MIVRTLIDASPRNAATGAAQAVRLGGGGTAALRHFGLDYRAGVVRSPRFSARLSFDENGWTGGTLPTTGTVVFAPAQATLLNQLAALFWKRAAITVQTGPEAGPFTTRLAGMVADASVAGGKLGLTIADLSTGIDTPLLTARFAGTGGIEGVTEATGRLKRRSFGRVFDIEGRILDKANNIWEFGDPSKQLQAFDALRDKGNAYPITVLAWQGSIAATLAALQAAAVPAGGIVAAPSIACAKPWTAPSTLAADLRGEIGAGYVEDVVGIAGRLLTAAGGPAVTNAVAAAAWRPGAAGIHIGDETETTAQALDRLLLGASLLWVLDPAGTITLRQISFAAPVEMLKPISSSRLQQLRPTKSRRVGYKRNQRQHNDGEIAAILRDAAYSDGTPIDNLKPADAGSTKNTYFTGASDPGGANGSLWKDTSTTPAKFRLKIAGNWVDVSTLVTDTGQLTDGAQLGLTALWAGIAGPGKPADNADVTALQAIVSRLSPTTGQALTNFIASDGRSFSKIAAIGEARDGDVVTFPATLPSVPKITFLPGGNAPTAGQNVAIQAEGLSTSGFTMKAKSQSVTAGATIVDGSAVAGTGSEPDLVINRTNGSAPYNGAFNFRYTVGVGNIAPGEPGRVEIGIYVKKAGVWVQAGAFQHSVTGTYTGTVYPGSVDFGAGNEFGVDLNYAEGVGSGLTGFTSVSYSLGGVTETSLTPSSASPIPWIAILS